jgi:hypothetical protein
MWGLWAAEMRGLEHVYAPESCGHHQAIWGIFVALFVTSCFCWSSANNAGKIREATAYPAAFGAETCQMH